MLAQRIVMCPPTFFDVRYAINPWMNVDTAHVQISRAIVQWSALKKAIERRARVMLVAASPGLPDMCFAANAGLVCGNRFVPSRFKHEQRSGEPEHYRRWFSANGFECVEMVDDVVFEGAGDALLDCSGDFIWMGHGRRSELAAASALRDLLGIDVVPLRLVDARFYHLDTCFCPLANGCAVYFPAAFDPPSLAAIRERFPADRRIEVSAADAMQFACNLVDLGDSVIVNGASDALHRAFGDRGLDVERLSLDEFLKAGGSAKCLVLPLEPPAVRADNARGAMHA